MATEYEQLEKRGFKHYSKGHQLMYEAPIKLLTGTKSDILDIGFGIGYGLDKMLQHGILKPDGYCGCEPDLDSYEYVKAKNRDLVEASKIHLFNCIFENFLCDRQFDYGFCIEVVEHLTSLQLKHLLHTCKKLITKTLFISTPDIRDNSHGKYKAEWLADYIYEAGYRVSFVREQWTTLFICNPAHEE